MKIGKHAVSVFAALAFGSVSYTVASNCVVQGTGTPPSCQACSGCTNGVCGTVEAEATCPNPNTWPVCSVAVGPNGPTYTATCKPTFVDPEPLPE